MRKTRVAVLGLSVLAISFGLYLRASRPPQTVLAAAPLLAQSAGQAAVSPQRKLIDTYCVECHNQDDRVANLFLDEMDPANVKENPEQWEKVVRKLRAGMMPPASKPRPDRATTIALVTWLESELDKSAVPYFPPPGMHRLNRTEYGNVIHDLLDLDIDPGRYLPTDDSTHGFDNIAGALSLSSTLVESYVSAAAKISRLALGEATTPSLTVYRAPEDTSQDYYVVGMPLGTRGGLLKKHLFPSDGEYQITVTPIFGDNMSPTGFGTIPCEKVEVLLDNERVQIMDWQYGGRVSNANCPGAISPNAAASGGGGGRNAAPPMEVRIPVKAGPHAIAVTFPQTNFAPNLDIDIHPMRDTVQTGPTPGYSFFPHVGTLRIEGPYYAVTAQDSPSRRRIFICRPTGPADEDACAQKIIRNLASQAFRRPATSDDVSSLMDFYKAGRVEEDFDHGVEMALSRILADPKFIYRMEVEPANAKDGQAYRISDLELASRLSFFLWSTRPDDVLINLANQGKLKDPAVLDQQVRRMLKDPRAEALAINFAGQWLNLRGMQAVGPLPLLYPDFDDPLRQAERREVELLFNSIVKEDRNIVDLLTADYTFVNERMAKHYGIPNVYGSQFRRVTLAPALDMRRGLLGKAAFLTTTAKPERNSPVSRGKWIMTNILGVSPPDPPPDVPTLKPSATDARGNSKTPTMRQKMEDHRASIPSPGNAGCVQCHRLMDPIGFSLENFDAIGLWRTEDEGTPITKSEVVYDGTTVNGPSGLRKWIVDTYSDQFVEVAAEKLLTYALGRGVDYQDMPLVRSIAHEAGRNNHRFSSLVLGVVRSKSFQMNMKMPETSVQKKEAN